MAHHRLLVLYPPPADPDHFRSYSEDTHLKLVAKIPGLLGYRYGFDVAAGEGDSPYSCVFEGDFDDAAAMGAALESPEGQAAVADIPNYATGDAVPPTTSYVPAERSAARASASSDALLPGAMGSAATLRSITFAAMG